MKVLRTRGVTVTVHCTVYLKNIYHGILLVSLVVLNLIEIGSLSLKIPLSQKSLPLINVIKAM